MSHKYDGRFMQSVGDVVERVFGRWLGSQRPLKSNPGAMASHPERTFDYGGEFDQSQHTRSIEYSRERSVGCYDAPTDGGDE
jgi:hypothetical protein